MEDPNLRSVIENRDLVLKCCCNKEATYTVISNIAFQVSPRQNGGDWFTSFTQIPALVDVLVFVTFFFFFLPLEMNIDICLDEKREIEREKWKEERGAIL